jgi:hypothetical protein
MVTRLFLVRYSAIGCLAGRVAAEKIAAVRRRENGG